MTINVSCGSFEATGIAEIKDVNISFEFGIEETTTVTKQILPIFRELKEYGIFQTKQDNDALCKKLNGTREEQREEQRELRQAKNAAELEKARLQAKVKELEEKLRNAEIARELKDQ